jgi:hypothetical protein
MFPVPVTPILAGVIAAERRKIVEAFRAAHATSPSRSKSAADLEIQHSGIFDVLVRRRILVQTADETFYLDEDRLGKLNRLRYWLLIVPIIAVIIALVVLFFALLSNR